MMINELIERLIKIKKAESKIDMELLVGYQNLNGSIVAVPLRFISGTINETIILYGIKEEVK